MVHLFSTVWHFIDVLPNSIPKWATLVIHSLPKGLGQGLLYLLDFAAAGSTL